MNSPGAEKAAMPGKSETPTPAQHKTPSSSVPPAVSAERPSSPEEPEATQPGEKAVSQEDEFAHAAAMLAHLEASGDIETIFQHEGIPLNVSGNTPLLLNSSGSVWLIQQGSVEIFAVHVENGGASGARSHVLHLEAGEILFGLDAEGAERTNMLIAVSSMGTSLLQLPSARLQQLSQAQEFAAIGIAALIDRWIATLSLSVKEEMPPKDCFLLTTEDGCHLNKEVNYQAPKGVGWIKHISGASTFMGRTDFPAIAGNGYFPVYEKTWLQTVESTELRYTSTGDLMTQETFWQSLEQFYLFILDCLIIRIERQRTAERERLRQKAEDERLSLTGALTSLMSVVKPQEAGAGGMTADPLLSACRIVGKHLNVSFVPHPDSRHGKSRLEDLARASRIKTRQVLLRDPWWRQDNGPLLAFREHDNRPLALLPTSARRYILVDPVEGTRQKVTRKIAESLDGIAYTFYRPFPERALSGLDLLKAALYGIKSDLSMLALMGVLGALLGLATPIVTSILFDKVIPGADMNQLVQIGLILLVCAIANALFEVIKAIAMLRIEGKADAGLQAAVWDRLLSLPTTFFRDYSSGDLAVRSMGINAIRGAMGGATVQSLLASIFSLVYLALLFYYDRRLALIATLISVFNVAIITALGYLYVRYQRPLSAIEGKISGTILQLITGISKLRITGTEDRAFAVWAAEFSKQRKLSFKAGVVHNVQEMVNAVIPVFASMIIFYAVFMKLMDPDPEAKIVALTTGKLLAFLTAYGMFQNTLIQMSTALMTVLSIVPLYNRLQPILTTPSEVDDTKSKPSRLTGEIEVSHVNFRYKPDGPLILRDLSLQISSGEFVAIVGGSGSGKSTLMRLLLGFETPESGTIYYDGQDLATVDVTEVRRQIGVVLQNSQIMAGSIFNNIAGAGSASLTVDDAWEAARMAGCYEDIREMPMGMHTVLPPGGGSLSGGQRQRIVIARSIIKKPRILFFDEATSALDNRTQSIVSESIEQLKATRIVIAHRLSTILNADRIYVMDKGRIVQIGTYEKLIKQEGLFAELAKRQML